MYLYIMLDPDKFDKCKVGITKNPPNRLRAYRTAQPQATFPYLVEIDNKLHEKEIFYILKNAFKVDREYVHCNYIIVQNIIEGYFNDLKERH